MMMNDDDDVYGGWFWFLVLVFLDQSFRIRTRWRVFDM